MSLQRVKAIETETDHVDTTMTHDALTEVTNVRLIIREAVVDIEATVCHVIIKRSMFRVGVVAVEAEATQDIKTEVEIRVTEVTHHLPPHLRHHRRPVTDALVLIPEAVQCHLQKPRLKHR